MSDRYYAHVPSQDVDAIHEYLLLKGVQAAAIHGGKDQEDRIKAVAEFRWEIHVLVAALVEIA